MKAIFAAGGTAGHINPALAIADKLKSVFPDAEIMFIGTPQGMEARLVTKSGATRRRRICTSSRQSAPSGRYSRNSSRISLSAPADTSPGRCSVRRRLSG